MKMTLEKRDTILTEVIEESAILDQRWEALDGTDWDMDLDSDRFFEECLSFVRDNRRLSMKAIPAVPGVRKIPTIGWMGVVILAEGFIAVLYKLYKILERLERLGS